MSETLVLSPTGNVGCCLSRLLHREGKTFRTGNRQDFDYFRPETYGSLFRGATHLFLVTPVVNTMVELTSVLLEHAKIHGIQRIVKISALGASPDSPTRLFRWHAESEALLRNSGIPWVILRPNAYMQNFTRYYARAIRERSVISIPAGDSRVSFIDAEDVAQIAFHALFESSLTGKTLEITGETAWSFSEAASALSRVLARPIRYVDASEEATQAAMLALGFPNWKVEALLELYRSYKSGKGSVLTQTFQEMSRYPPQSLECYFAKHKGDLQ